MDTILLLCNALVVFNMAQHLTKVQDNLLKSHIMSPAGRKRHKVVTRYTQHGQSTNGERHSAQLVQVVATCKVQVAVPKGGCLP